MQMCSLELLQRGRTGRLCLCLWYWMGVTLPTCDVGSSVGPSQLSSLKRLVTTAPCLCPGGYDEHGQPYCAPFCRPLYGSFANPLP